MTEGATTTARAAAIEDFAAALRSLRESVGTPSFRELSGRSRAISHTTLHEAAQGNRLPSWSTTVEFVKACGADPADYRQRWDVANLAVRTAVHPLDEVEVSNPAATQVDEEPDDTTVVDLVDGTARPRVRRRYVLPGLAAVGVVVAATFGMLASADGDDGRGAPVQGAQLSASDCPIHRHNPPPAAPAAPGDSGSFIGDITLPDCTHIGPGRTVVKVWRLKNVGTVPWRGYSMRRLAGPQGRDQCQTISDVPIDDTLPGRFVDVRTEVTTPKRAGFCFVGFQVMNGADRVAFPGGRPLNFQLVIDPAN